MALTRKDTSNVRTLLWLSFNQRDYSKWVWEIQPTIKVSKIVGLMTHNPTFDGWMDNQTKLDMFPGTWGCPRHVRFACHTSSMHIQSTKAKSKHQKQQYLFLISSKFVMVSKFNIYTVHLKCFDSIRYHLNQYKTVTKNFNQGLNSGELVWKMAKSKHQKQH